METYNISVDDIFKIDETIPAAGRAMTDEEKEEEIQPQKFPVIIYDVVKHAVMREPVNSDDHETEQETEKMRHGMP